MTDVMVQAVKSLEERSEASELYRMLKAGPATVTDASGHHVALRGRVREAMMEVALHLDKGQSLQVVAVPGFLTTQQAAELLGCSRPYLITLLEKGEIPFEMVGTHRKVVTEGFMEYKVKRDLERRKILREMTQDAVRWGAYDVKVPLEPGQSDE